MNSSQKNILPVPALICITLANSYLEAVSVDFVSFLYKFLVKLRVLGGKYTGGRIVMSNEERATGEETPQGLSPSLCFLSSLCLHYLWGAFQWEGSMYSVLSSQVFIAQLSQTLEVFDCIEEQIR